MVCANRLDVDRLISNNIGGFLCLFWFLRSPKHLCNKLDFCISVEVCFGFWLVGWFVFLLVVWFDFVVLRRGRGRLAYCNTGSCLDVCDLW